jgi:hypothetical protein
MTTTRSFSSEELDTIHGAIARLRADVMSVVFGLAAGTALFMATIWLVLRGPAEGQTAVGSHLGLLRYYFPGYQVTVLGSFIGFLYGALVGALIGWIIAFVYNTLANKRQKSWDK